MKPVYQSSTSRGREIVVPAVGGWDGFDKLRAFLVKCYAATVMDATDGPDTRACRLRIGECELTIEYEDPFENAIVCRDEGCAVFDEIFVDLTARFARGT